MALLHPRRWPVHNTALACVSTARGKGSWPGLYEIYNQSCPSLYRGAHVYSRGCRDRLCCGGTHVADCRVTRLQHQQCGFLFR